MDKHDMVPRWQSLKVKLWERIQAEPGLLDFLEVIIELPPDTLFGPLWNPTGAETPKAPHRMDSERDIHGE